MNAWVKTVRERLIEHEKGVIAYRLAAWQNVINTCTKNVLQRIFITDYVLPPFLNTVTDIQMNVILSLILQWNGLKTRFMDKKNVQNLTFKQYNSKAKNWWNGCRARHYAHTLYPIMIEMAETYTRNIATNIFNDALQSDKCISLFFNICMCSYLHQLHALKIRVSKSSRRVYLLCDNSLISSKRNQTTILLQKYACNHKYVERFPLHRPDAMDHFAKEKANNVKALLIIIQENKLHSGNILDLVSFIGLHCKTDNGKRVIIGYKVCNAINNIIQYGKESEMKAKQEINQLQTRIEELEKKNFHHQSKQETLCNYRSSTELHEHWQTQKNKDGIRRNNDCENKNGYNTNNNNDNNNTYNNNDNTYMNNNSNEIFNIPPLMEDDYCMLDMYNFYDDGDDCETVYNII